MLGDEAADCGDEFGFGFVGDGTEALGDGAGFVGYCHAGSLFSDIKTKDSWHIKIYYFNRASQRNREQNELTL